MKQNSGMRRKQFEFGSSQMERPCNKSNDATTTIYYKVMSLEIIRCHMMPLGLTFCSYHVGIGKP